MAEYESTILNDTRQVNGLRRFMAQTYSYMAVAVGITAFVGFIVQNFLLPAIINAFQGYSVLLTIAVIAVQIGILFVMNRVAAQSAGLAFAMLAVFAVTEGFVFGIVLAIYSLGAIMSAFFSAVAIFGTMAVYGVTTKRDLSGMRSILFGLLIGLIAATLINLVIGSGIMSYLMSYVGVMIFAGFTAYDVQNLKAVYIEAQQQHLPLNGLGVQGALQLYLDFINIFIDLVRIFGAFGNDD